jgi:hypothetical protein
MIGTGTPPNWKRHPWSGNPYRCEPDLLRVVLFSRYRKWRGVLTDDRTGYTSFSALLGRRKDVGDHGPARTFATLEAAKLAALAALENYRAAKVVGGRRAEAAHDRGFATICKN